MDDVESSIRAFDECSALILILAPFSNAPTNLTVSIVVSRRTGAINI